MSKPKPTPGTSQSFPSIVVSWLMLRFLLALVVLIGSANRPETALEKDMAVWPPASSFGRWLDRVLVRPWQRWDTEYYLNIAERGYRLDDGSTQFHPFYPWMGRVFGYVLGGNMLLGLLAASSVCGLLFLIGFERLARLDLSPGASHRAAVYLLHAPLAFVLFAPYTEALFLLSSVIVFLMARRRAWWMAGTAAGLAALTRQQGIFLLIPLAWELWEWSGRDWRKVLVNWRSALSLALAPAGLLVWLVYRAVVLADIAFDLDLRITDQHRRHPGHPGAGLCRALAGSWRRFQPPEANNRGGSHPGGHFCVDVCVGWAQSLAAPAVLLSVFRRRPSG